MRKEPLAISVNLSVSQLQSDSIVSDVRVALETSGLPPESLVAREAHDRLVVDLELVDLDRLLELCA